MVAAVRIRQFIPLSFESRGVFGIRRSLFEWKGTMIHARTALADRRWARIPSTTLNVAAWLSNWELDAVIEDERRARRMALPRMSNRVHPN